MKRNVAKMALVCSLAALGGSASCTVAPLPPECHGDPCCGDPCCGDPCCGDPNCAQPAHAPPVTTTATPTRAQDLTLLCRNARAPLRALSAIDALRCYASPSTQDPRIETH